MTTIDTITEIFCFVDDTLDDLPKHSQAKLYPSEVVAIGILYALKGGHFRAFYRWLAHDYTALFPRLPDRTRLLRLLETHQEWCDNLLAEPSFFTVIDCYPIELIFPIREGRSKRQAGTKGKDKGRWTIGIKYCWLLNRQGQVVDWEGAPLDIHDQELHSIIERHDGQTIVLSDYGFNSADSLPANLSLAFNPAAQRIGRDLVNDQQWLVGCALINQTPAYWTLRQVRTDLYDAFDRRAYALQHGLDRQGVSGPPQRDQVILPTA